MSDKAKRYFTKVNKIECFKQKVYFINALLAFDKIKMPDYEAMISKVYA